MENHSLPILCNTPRNWTVKVMGLRVEILCIGHVGTPEPVAFTK